MSLPERINVIKTVTYDVPAIIEGMRELGWGDDEITESVVYEYIEDCLGEDFGDTSDLIWQDENGEEL